MLLNLGGVRYSDELEEALKQLDGIELLRLEYEACYQGYCDVDVLLSDGRVFSYNYWYGSCSGCDEWEARELSEEEITQQMIDDGTFFDSLEQYHKYRDGIIKVNK